LYGLGVLGQQNGSTWSTFGTDPLGSVRFLIGSTGDPTSRADYDPYGVPLPVPGQESGMPSALGFTGEQTDPLGLVNLRARTYNPRWGTFTSVDPVLGVGGSTGWNGYVYANANPANLTDPSGEFAPLLFAGLVVLLGGLTFGGIPAAAEWRVAHDCQCGDPSVRNADPFGFVASRTAVASAIGLGLIALPELVLPFVVAGTGFSALQVASYWNPSDPWEAFKRGEGILGTVLGVASLPFAARATSGALNSRLWYLSRTDPLFHPDVVYPQVQGYLWQRLSSVGTVTSIVDDTSDFYNAYSKLTKAERAGIEAKNTEMARQLFATNPEISSKIPAHWKNGPTQHGSGWRWWDPTKKGRANNVRIDLPDPWRESLGFTTQGIPHVVINSGGKGIGVGGVIYENVQANWDISHIPLTEWLTWKYWNQP
ncbi:MAG: RHS repeat-associated core domain-containing protein, partial [Anaerolinea sp.]|nr:RHS repeat-associated core domain-containing protein [Anaerolinea sp.]